MLLAFSYEGENCYYLEVVKFLLMQQLVDINAQDKHGATALHEVVSCRRGGREREEIIDALLKNGANIQLKNIQGKTALDIASAEKDKAAIQQLLSHATTHSLPLEWVMSQKTFNKISDGKKSSLSLEGEG